MSNLDQPQPTKPHLVFVEREGRCIDCEASVAIYVDDGGKFRSPCDCTPAYYLVFKERMGNATVITR